MENKIAGENAQKAKVRADKRGRGRKKAPFGGKIDEMEEEENQSYSENDVGVAEDKENVHQNIGRTTRAAAKFGSLERHGVLESEAMI